MHHYLLNSLDSSQTKNHGLETGVIEFIEQTNQTYPNKLHYDLAHHVDLINILYELNHYGL